VATQNLVCSVDGNDGHWRPAYDLLTNNLSLAIVGDNGGVASHAFYRFQLSASITQNSTVTSASFEPVAVDTASTSLTYTAKIHKVANSAQPTGSSADLEVRTYTAGTSFVTPSTTSGSRFAHAISAELQELVNFTALTSGDWITVVLISQTSPSNQRRYSCNENGAGTRANFDFSYDAPPAAGGTSKNILTLGVG
jgi:hypothetical protein